MNRDTVHFSNHSESVAGRAARLRALLALQAGTCGEMELG
jgi:hypothetical protein